MAEASTAAVAADLRRFLVLLGRADDLVHHRQADRNERSPRRLDATGKDVTVGVHARPVDVGRVELEILAARVAIELADLRARGGSGRFFGPSCTGQEKGAEKQ